MQWTFESLYTILVLMHVNNSIRKLIENFKITEEFYSGNILFDEPIAPRTTFHIGGIAPVLFEPFDEQSLVCLINFLKANDLDFFILGGGSNLVVSDEGFAEVVISTSKINFIKILPTDDDCDFVDVQIGSGTLMKSVVDFCVENVLSGIEKFAGLPGSIGGAVFMNARCFDISISELVYSVSYFDLSKTQVFNYQFNEADWAYKLSPFQTGNKIILSAVLRLKKCDNCKKDELAVACKKYIEERESRGHFKFPSAGSVFKNNRVFGKPSGQIIDEVGLRGMSVGDAQVAPWHGNFIINNGNATQKDVKQLVEYIVETVKNKTGFTLEPEIIFCGI